MYLTCLQSFYTPPLRSPVVHVDSQVSCRQPKSKTMRLLYHCNNWDSFPCVFIFTTHAWWFQVLLWCLFSLLFQLTKLLPFYLYNHSGICFWRLMFCSKLCKLSLTMLISIYLIITLLVKKKKHSVSLCALHFYRSTLLFVCILLWCCVVSFHKKHSTLWHHNYFSANSSYCSVPIIDKCWLECCLST